MNGISKLLESSIQNSSVWGLWNWNGTVTCDEMESQLKQLVSKGFTGLVVRPASDIVPAYLSDEYFILFERLLTLAKECNIQIMLADDFTRLGNSPLLSGISQSRNYRASRLVVEHEWDLEEEDRFTFNPNPIERSYVVAVKRNKRKVILADAVTLYNGEGVDEVEWMVPEGHWKVIQFNVKYEKNVDNAHVPNFFSMKAAQLYITEVLDLFKDKFLPKYKGTFAGVFNEMPSIIPSIKGVPWDDELLISKYRSRFKRNLIETMPALYYGVADHEAKYRPHVYSFIQDTIYERFPAVIQKWAEQNKLQHWVIGAESDRGDQESALTGLFSIPSEKFSVVGTASTGTPLANEAAFITIASRCRGAKGIETVGIAGRSNCMEGVTLGLLKREVDSYAAAGASHIVIDGFHFNRNYRFEESSPQGISFGHQDFDHLDELIDETKKVLALQANAEVAKKQVAVVFPSNSIMADYTPAEAEIISRTLHNFIDIVGELRRDNRAFTVVDEQYLLSCKINAEGEIVDPNGVIFNAVVLAYSRLINNSFFVLLEKFAKKKMPLFFLDNAPEGSFDDGHSLSFVQRVQKMVKSKTKRVDYGPVWSVTDNFLPNEDEALTLDLPKGTKGVVLNTVTTKGETTFWVYNGGEEEISLGVEGGEEISAVAVASLNVDSSEVVSVVDGGAMVSVLPGESKLIWPSDEEASSEISEDSYRIKLKEDKWRFVGQSLNSFPLSRWNSKIGINRSRGNISHYYESHFISERTVESAYITFLNSIPESKKQITDRFKLSVNGTEVFPVEQRLPEEGEKSAFFDESTTLLIYDISQAVVRGNNRVLILSNGDADLPDPVSYPLFVSVDGAVDQTGKGWTILSNSEDKGNRWGGHGYPYMVGAGSYTMNFEVPKNYDKIYLNFKTLSGSAEVKLNGVEFETVKWAPYRIDITDAVTSNSRNELEVTVRNGMDVINRLKGDESGIVGGVFLDIYGDSGDESVGEV